jgi:16S rRNA (adenine1518-N6/adenine1519-N6)-dimethyltransferase
MNKRKKLGQHYLIDIDTISKIIEIATIKKNERVLEIGTGKGALTSELSKTEAQIEAYEIDRKNYLFTKEKIRNIRSIRLHHKDAFKVNPQFDVLVASLPYSRSSTFIEWLSKQDYDRVIVVLQEDFVRKITSHPGTKNYRAISIISQISSQVDIKGRIGRSSFYPQPKVNSFIVMVKLKLRLSNFEILMIKKLFSLKRKKLKTALKNLDLNITYMTSEELEQRIWLMPSDKIYEIVQRLN